MDVDIAEPIKENVPNINTKLCKSCGACVQACKTGSIKIHAVDTGEAYSVIIPVSDADIVLESVRLMQLNMVSFFQKQLKAEKLLLLIRMFVSVV